MNIEQIALEVADELFLGGKAIGHEPVEFLRRCLSKLAEQDVEPSFWLCRGELFEVEQRFFPPNNEPIPGQEKLYTETQLLAAQQCAAKACLDLAESKPANGNFRFTHREEISEAIRNEKWREYL